MVITIAQLHSTKPKLWFCVGSNPARCMSDIRDGEDLHLYHHHHHHHHHQKQYLINGKAIFTNCLYKSIVSANWLLARDITTAGTLQKVRQSFPSGLFDMKDRDELSATCHSEKDICFILYIIKTKSKGEINVALLSKFRPLHGKRIDDGKEKPQIVKVPKSGTDIVDKLNDYYTTREKSCQWWFYFTCLILPM